MITRTAIKKVYKAIHQDLIESPLIYSEPLSTMSGAMVYLKLEHQQITGSFKWRGMLSKMHQMEEVAIKNKTFVAASTGNHAAAFCHAATKFGFKGVLFLPKTVNPTKVAALDDTSIILRFYGENSMEAEEQAMRYAKEINGVLVHPYNDSAIVTGQGTLGLEIEEQLPEVSRVLIPIGGGGLASGIGCYFADNQQVKVIGCQPQNASEMYQSIKEGYIVTPSRATTICDATAGGMVNDTITFDWCKQYVEHIDICTEESVKRALVFLIKHHNLIIEPSSALPVAALMNSSRYKGEHVVLVLTGKKINPELLNEIITTYGDSN